MRHSRAANGGGERKEKVSRFGRQERLNEIGALLLALLAVFLVISFATYDPRDIPALQDPPNDPPVNRGGKAGAWACYGFYNAVGFASWLVPVVLLAWVVAKFRGKTTTRFGVKVAGVILLLASAAGCLAFFCGAPSQLAFSES